MELLDIKKSLKRQIDDIIERENLLSKEVRKSLKSRIDEAIETEVALREKKKRVPKEF